MSCLHQCHSINEQNKISRAKVLAEKHIQKINILILQAKELGLEDSVSKLEQSKLNLISSNSTSQIKQNVKIIIVLNNTIQKSKVAALEEVELVKLQLSQKQKFSLQIAQLETKLNVLGSDAHGNNVAIYYLDKAASLVKSAKLDLDNSLNDVPKQIKQIQSIILKIERALQQST